MYFGSKYRHHIRAVEIIGDIAKALRLALGAEIAIRQVQALEPGVGRGVDFNLAIDFEAIGNRADSQGFSA